MPPSRRLRIAVWNHASKAAPFINALAAAGHEFCQNINDDVDAMLMDLDPPYLAHLEMLERYSEQNAKIFLYPHGGGGPILSYDGLWEPDKRVFANFVMGVGHAEYLRRLDYPAETHVIGWPYCDILPFRAREDVKTRPLRPDAPERRRLDDELPARHEHRRVPPAAADPVQAHGPPHRHARAERAVEGRRRRVRPGPPRRRPSTRSTRPTPSSPPTGRSRRSPSPAACRPSSTARASSRSACPTRSRSSRTALHLLPRTTPASRSTSPTATSRRSSAPRRAATRRSRPGSAASSARSSTRWSSSSSSSGSAIGGPTPPRIDADPRPHDARVRRRAGRAPRAAARLRRGLRARRTTRA